MIEIDGAQGEGGGQVLRSALALAIVTGRAVRIVRVRANRQKPGLMRQHLTAVRAAARVGAAAVTGDHLGSREVTFVPGAIIAGEHHFDIGTAGSTTLVLQTVLWPLIMANDDSTIVLQGGTHNPLAPPVPFLQHTLLPVLRSMGARIDLTLHRAGFYPVGGGRIVAYVRGGATLAPIEILHRGALGKGHARALVANLPTHIAERELDVVHDRLGWPRARLHAESIPAAGPGNALLLEQPHGAGTTVVSAIGERGRRAEHVAAAAVDELARFLAADVPVDEHLADQLLIPLALAGGGSFRTLPPTLHTITNAAIVERFLPVRIAITDEGSASRITITSARG